MSKQDLKQAVDEYQMSETSRALLAQSPVVMMVSITGGGKNTIIEELLKTGRYHYVISHTTRRPRENDGRLEQNGVNYWFVSESEMLDKLRSGDFIEAKWVHDSYVYGTSIDEIKKAQDSGKVPLLEIEVQGVAEIKRAKAESVAVFVVPPDYRTWMNLLTSRGEIVDAELDKRIDTAKKELKAALENDYFQFLVNDDLDLAVENAKRIVAGEQLETDGRAVAAELLQQIESS